MLSNLTALFDIKLLLSLCYIPIFLLGYYVSILLQWLFIIVGQLDITFKIINMKWGFIMKNRILRYGAMIVLALGLLSGCNGQVDVASNESPAQEVKEDRKILKGVVLARNISELVEKADIVVSLKIGEKVRELSEPSPKTIFETSILEIYKDNGKIEDTIQLMQAGNSEFSFNGEDMFKNGEEMILFLRESNDAEFENTNTYWILGEYSAYFKIKDNDINVNNPYKELKAITKEIKKGKKEIQVIDKQKFIDKIMKEVSKSHE
jgi:hypothetical protein